MSEPSGHERDVAMTPPETNAAAPVGDLTSRVWGWKSPWSGDENDPSGVAYEVWFWLYAKNQRIRHLFGLHQKQRHFSISPRCDWCGSRDHLR